MKDSLVRKILGHPSEDEIVSKLAMGASPSDVHDWLDKKYSPSGQTNFIVSVATLKKFNEDFLDFYQHMKKDEMLVRANVQKEMELSVKKNPAYHQRIKELVNSEIDLRKTIATLTVAVESRVAAVFDMIQENYETSGKFNSKDERVFIEYARVLGETLEKYYKFVEQPKEIVSVTNNSVTIQVMDQHVSIIQEAIKEIIEGMDIEMSLKFIELVTEKMGKIKMPNEAVQSIESRAVEGKLLTENMAKQLDAIK